MIKVLANIIRKICASPVLAAILLFALYFSDIGVFNTPLELVLSVLLLGIVPALSYPICRAVPQIEKFGRNTQRELEILLSLVGGALA